MQQLLMGTVSVLSPLERFRELQGELETARDPGISHEIPRPPPEPARAPCLTLTAVPCPLAPDGLPRAPFHTPQNLKIAPHSNRSFRAHNLPPTSSPVPIRRPLSAASQPRIRQVLPVCHRPSEKVVRDWVAKLGAENALALSVAAADEAADGAAPPSLDAQVAAFRERWAAVSAEVSALLDAHVSPDGADDGQLPSGLAAVKREDLLLLKAQAAHLQRKGASDAEMKAAVTAMSGLLSRLTKAAHPPDPGLLAPGAKRSRRKAAEQPTDTRAMSRFISNSMIALRRKLTRVAAWAQCDVGLFVRFNSRRQGTAFGLSGSEPLTTEESLQLADILKARIRIRIRTRTGGIGFFSPEGRGGE